MTDSLFSITVAPNQEALAAYVEKYVQQQLKAAVDDSIRSATDAASSRMVIHCVGEAIRASGLYEAVGQYVTDAMKDRATETMRQVRNTVKQSVKGAVRYATTKGETT